MKATSTGPFTVASFSWASPCTPGTSASTPACWTFLGAAAARPGSISNVTSRPPVSRRARQNQRPEYPVEVPISTTVFAPAASARRRSARPSSGGTLRYVLPPLRISSRTERILFSLSLLAARAPWGAAPRTAIAMATIARLIAFFSTLERIHSTFCGREPRRHAVGRSVGPAIAPGLPARAGPGRRRARPPAGGAGRAGAALRGGALRRERHLLRPRQRHVSGAVPAGDRRPGLRLRRLRQRRLDGPLPRQQRPLRFLQAEDARSQRALPEQPRRDVHRRHREGRGRGRHLRHGRRGRGLRQRRQPRPVRDRLRALHPVPQQRRRDG